MPKSLFYLQKEDDKMKDVKIPQITRKPHPADEYKYLQRKFEKEKYLAPCDEKRLLVLEKIMDEATRIC